MHEGGWNFDRTMSMVDGDDNSDALKDLPLVVEPFAMRANFMS